MAHCTRPWSRGTRPGETFKYLATSAMRNGTRACLRGSSRIRARSGPAAASGRAGGAVPWAAHVSDA